MTKLTFKNFVSEAASGKAPTYKPVELKEARRIFLEKCSDAKWMAQINAPIYRGDRNAAPKIRETGFAVVDPSLTERKSQNTWNHYTVILDNNPKTKEFPKRSRSFIASTDDDYAGGFGEVSVVIPFNGTKIGVVNSMDIWDVPVVLFGRRITFDQFSDYMQGMDVKENIEDFKRVDSELRDGNKKLIVGLHNHFPHATAEDANNFLKKIFTAFDPISTQFESLTTKTLKKVMEHKSEVWVGGPCLVMSRVAWDKLRKELTKK